MNEIGFEFRSEIRRRWGSHSLFLFPFSRWWDDETMMCFVAEGNNGEKWEKWNIYLGVMMMMIDRLQCRWINFMCNQMKVRGFYFIFTFLLLFLRAFFFFSQASQALISLLASSTLRGWEMTRDLRWECEKEKKICFRLKAYFHL